MSGNSPNTTKRKLPSNHHDEKNKKTHVQVKAEKMDNSDMNSNCLCGICFDHKKETEMFRGSKCNHPFCADCISKHVAAQIQQNALKVNCPKPNCGVELEPEYLNPILPEEVIVRLESARCESLIAGLPKTYCPFKDCSVLLVDDGGEVVTTAECPSCHRLFCAQCLVPWHAGLNCKEYLTPADRKVEKDLDRKFLDLAKNNMWQRCPKCNFYVQRTSGCEHMACRF